MCLSKEVVALKCNQPKTVDVHSAATSGFNLYLSVHEKMKN